LGQVDEAENAYRAAIALAERTGTRAAWSHLNLALLYDSAGNPTLADAEFREAIEIAPDVEWMYYHYGSFLEGRGELGAAQSIYQTLTQVARDKGWAYGNLAKLFLRHGLFQEAVHHQPEDALLHTYMAETYLALDDVERALGAYEEAVRYGEELYYVFASFGVALFQTGNLERAAQVYERSLALRPLDGAVMLNLGQTYESLGRAEEARELYRRTLSLRDQFSQDVVGVASARLAALEVESR
jgi:tetratricopeptide (TPR) repeat protein